LSTTNQTSQTNPFSKGSSRERGSKLKRHDRIAVGLSTRTLQHVLLFLHGIGTYSSASTTSSRIKCVPASTPPPPSASLAAAAAPTANGCSGNTAHGGGSGRNDHVDNCAWISVAAVVEDDKKKA
jgi:hypothetical protein